MERIDHCRQLMSRSLIRDAAWAAGRVERAQQRLAAAKPVDRLLHEVECRLADSAALVSARGETALTIAYPEELPVSAARDEVLRHLDQRGVLVLTGETGSGKTTQIPKMLLEAGCGRRGRIACTQPRRVAAQSVGRRLAEELRASGAAVASAVRFADQTADDTLIAVMTDGLLLAEAGRDRELLRYDAIVIDEAHERSLNIDVLLGLVRDLRRRRPELRVVITSATIDAERFAAYFADEHGPAPVVAVSGRGYPIEVEYHPPADADLGYLEAAITALRELHTSAEAGDVLCFLPTERDILEAQRRLRGEAGMSVLPLFGRLNAGEQQRVFAPARGRKVVLATNIAETSITVPGIRYVVDTGLARIKRFVPSARTERLPVEAVAQASLNQRMGRAGRTGPGLCLRLFDQADAAGRPEFGVAEIRRSNLAGVLLQHLHMGLGDPEVFPWLEEPTHGAWQQARLMLDELGALDDERRKLTAVGRRLARIPADPHISRMLLAGVDEGAAHEVCTLAAFLSVQDPRLRPVGEEGKADQAHAAWHHEAGDLVTVLTLWQAYQEQPSHGARARFAKANYLGYRRMREWADVRHQLWQALREDRAVGALPSQAHAADAWPIDAIHRALLAGMLGNVMYYDQRERCYRASGNRLVRIHPGSALRAGRDAERRAAKRAPSPPWLVACEVVETSRLFGRLCAPIDPAWIEQLASR
ncbi:MAG: ATP-dependent RNA helicase HrpA, partial [Planctomycetota bacterium]